MNDHHSFVARKSKGNQKEIKRKPSWSSLLHPKPRMDDERLSLPWAGFTRTVVPNGHPTATCKTCNKEIRSAQVKRNLVPHALGCKDFKHMKEINAWLAQQGNSNSKPHAQGAPANASCTCPCSCGARATPTPQTGFLLMLQLAFARFVFSSGSAFRLVENKRFQAFIRMMYPAFSFPSRQRVATKLLQIVYDEERELVIEELKHVLFVTIVTDGWTNPNNEGIVNFIITSPITKPVFFKSICTGTNKHTAEYMLEQVELVIDEVEQAIGADKVVAVLADNAQTMVSMQRQLEINRPQIFGNGCAAHGMDLLVKDIASIPFLSSAIESCVKLTKFIKKRSALALTFRQIQRSTHAERHKGLRLPVATRWYTSESCLAGACQNEWAVRSLFTKCDLLSRYETNAGSQAKLTATVTIVKDKSFWERSQVTLDFIAPINDALAMFESDKCSLSMVYHVFNDLMKHKVYSKTPTLLYNETPTYPEPSARAGPRPRKRHATTAAPTSKAKGKQPISSTTSTDESAPELELHELIKKMVHKRWLFIHSSATGIAFLLDHSKSTRDFVGDDYHIAREETVKYAKRLSEIRNDDDEYEFRKQLDNFENMKNFWGRNDINMSAPPFKWWYNTNGFGRLRPLALRIFSICTSSAASERAWSAFKFLHSDLRNKLNHKTIDKLVFIYTNMDRNDKQSNDMLYLTDPGFEDGDPDDDTTSPSKSNTSDRENSASSSFQPNPTQQQARVVLDDDHTQRRLSMDSDDSTDLGYDHLSPNLEASLSV